MENLEDCSICFLTLDELKHRPRTLPCGHTFCSPCIGDMIESDQLSCPTCRDHYTATSVTQFPINFIAEAFVKQRKATKPTPSPAEETAPAGSDGKVEPADDTSQKKFKGISSKLQTKLDKEKNRIDIVVRRGQEVQTQLDHYRTQLTDWKTQHLADLVLVKQEETRVLGMKREGEEGEKQLKDVLELLTSVRTAKETIRGINHAKLSTVEAEDWMQKCQELFSDDNTINVKMKAWDITKTAMETTDAEIAATEDNTKMGTYKMIGLGILTIMTLGLYLSSASLSVTGARDCATWTPDRTPRPLPHPASTLHLSQWVVVVEVEVELMMPQHFGGMWSVIWHHSSSSRVGEVALSTYTGQEEVEKIWVACVGDLFGVEVPAVWSTPANLMTSPRHAIIQMEARRVTVSEVVGGRTWLVATRTCDKAYPGFPDITVEVGCSGDCGQVRQCKKELPTTAPPTTAPPTTAPPITVPTTVPPTTALPNYLGNVVVMAVYVFVHIGMAVITYSVVNAVKIGYRFGISWINILSFYLSLNYVFWGSIFGTVMFFVFVKYYGVTLLVCTYVMNFVAINYFGFPFEKSQHIFYIFFMNGLIVIAAKYYGVIL